MANKTQMTDYEIEVASFALVFIRKHRAYFEAQKMPEAGLMAAAAGWGHYVVAERAKGVSIQ